MVPAMRYLLYEGGQHVVIIKTIRKKREEGAYKELNMVRENAKQGKPEMLVLHCDFLGVSFHVGARCWRLS